MSWRRRYCFSSFTAFLAEFSLGGGVIKVVAGDLGAGDAGKRAAGTVGMCTVTIGTIIAIIASRYNLCCTPSSRS
ncbi:MAG: hypothetical protein ACRD1T_22660 [Acidimicrobiia bacterium]